VPSPATEQISGRQVGGPPYHNIQEVDIMSLVREGLYAFAAGAAACCVLYVAAAYSVETHVSIDNFAFKTDTITVPVGSTVIWENRDDTPHNVVAVAGGFRSPALDTEDKFSFSSTRQEPLITSAACIPS
jgi:plastocyanin